MTRAMHDFFGNPSSIHSHGRKAKAAIEEARKTVAHHLGCSVGEIFFTSGGTEANNTAIKSAVFDLNVNRIITSPIEHPCVLRSIEHLSRLTELEVIYLKVDDKGRVAPEQLRTKLNRSPGERTLVSIMHANNEIGTMNDVVEIGNIAKESNAIFHSDTVQTIGHFPIKFSGLNIDLASASAHKFHGPKGIGLLYVREPGLKPLLDGGGQERNMRAGTENVPAIIGMAKALDIYMSNLASYEEKTRELRDYALCSIRSHFPEVRVNGCPDGTSLYTVLSITFPASMQSELLIFNLDIEGISASGGSACSSGVQKVSHVLANLTPDDTGTTVRFSFSPYNSKNEIDFLLEKLRKIVKR